MSEHPDPAPCTCTPSLQYAGDPFDWQHYAMGPPPRVTHADTCAQALSTRIIRNADTEYGTNEQPPNPQAVGRATVANKHNTNNGMQTSANTSAISRESA